jgi:hypothetical protein
MNQIRRNPNLLTALWAWLAMVVAIVVRLLLWLIYQPVSFSDTPSYRRLAESVSNGFERYDGTRTPGYPAFLALVGSDKNVWLVQMAFGVLIALALFYLGWRMSGKAWIGGLLSIAHSANLGQLFFEANLLTETLTTFCLAIVAVCVYRLLQEGNNLHPGLVFLAGLGAAIALLTRPLFIYLPVLVGLAFLLFKPGQLFSFHFNRQSLAKLGLFSIPVLLLAGGWILFIHQRFGDWALTTMTGYHLVQHTGDYFEYVPDEYAELRDTYIHYRDAHIAEYGTQTNTIWEAIPEMSEVSGLNFYDLSRTLAKISVRLILQHPDLYLNNVLQGWWMFWRAPVYWSPEALKVQGLVKPIQVLITIERMLLWIINLAFIVGSVFWTCLSCLPVNLQRKLPARIRKLSWRSEITEKLPPQAQLSHQFMLFMAGNIWLASTVQSLVDHGDNPRFLVPLQSFVLLYVVWLCLKLLKKP